MRVVRLLLLSEAQETERTTQQKTPDYNTKPRRPRGLLAPAPRALRQASRPVRPFTPCPIASSSSTAAAALKQLKTSHSGRGHLVPRHRGGPTTRSRRRRRRRRAAAAGGAHVRRRVDGLRQLLNVDLEPLLHRVQRLRIGGGGDEGDGEALGAEAPRAADAVQVRVRGQRPLRALGHVVV